MRMERILKHPLVKPAAGLAGLVLIVIWSAGLLRNRQPPGQLEADAGLAVPPGSEILTVQTGTVPVRVSLSGTVHSERRINLSARLPAYVEAVHVSAGATVSEGDLLIELDQRELLKDLAAADAQLEQAETAFQRSARLLETSATTAQAHESAELLYKSAQANVERIKVMLSYTRIRSPLNGVVADRYIEAGDLAGAGQVLLSVYDPDRLRLEVPTPARLIGHMPEGRNVDVMLDQVPGTIKGTVTEVVSEFDPVTRTRRVKIRLHDLAVGDVLPGMYGQVIIEIDPVPAILLPLDALTRIGQLESVLTLRDGRVERRLVRTGPRHDGRVEILAGLENGDTVVVPERSPSPPPSRSGRPGEKPLAE